MVRFGFRTHQPLLVINTESIFKLLFYLPTPPLGQDMTQGQFLSGV